MMQMGNASGAPPVTPAPSGAPAQQRPAQGVPPVSIEVF